MVDLRDSGSGSPPRGLPPGYPKDLERDVTTRVGERVRVRPIRPDDAARLMQFHEQLSEQSVYRRFFSVHPRLSPSEVARFTRVDYVDRLALVVEDDGQLIAIGRYDRTVGTPSAEVAFVVADRFQHHGIGTLLLELLADAARPNGITTFVAQTMAENRDMLRVFGDSGFPVTTSLEGGIVNVAFPIEPDDAYRSARAARYVPDPGPSADGEGGA